uniref:Uncharacterized protein n=1 Tax=Trichogramma kaykai TaxID=54128 RepID=A0ABD2WDN7_9HYME
MPAMCDHAADCSEKGDTTIDDGIVQDRRLEKLSANKIKLLTRHSERPRSPSSSRDVYDHRPSISLQPEAYLNRPSTSSQPDAYLNGPSTSMKPDNNSARLFKVTTFIRSLSRSFENSGSSESILSKFESSNSLNSLLSEQSHHEEKCSASMILFIQNLE